MSQTFTKNTLDKKSSFSAADQSDSQTGNLRFPSQTIYHQK